MSRDATDPVVRRVDDLLARMTLDEKIAQLGSTYADPIMEDGSFSPEKAGDVMPSGIGQVSAIQRGSGKVRIRQFSVV